MKKLDNSVCLSDFGELIQRERKRLDLSQEEVAKEVGIHRTYYGKIEAGSRDLPFVTALRICMVLKIDPSDFIKNYM
jgi:transcriptional regulator with XRE-family HTH domain